MHKLLDKQLRRHLAKFDRTAPEFASFLTAVGDAYTRSDEARYLMECSLNMAAQESLRREEHRDQESRERARVEGLRKERADRLSVINEAILRLTRNCNLIEGDLPGVIRLIVELCAHQFNIARVSVWVFDAGRSHIWCEDLYSLADSSHSSGHTLAVKDFPAYFFAVEHILESQRTISADNALTHPVTCEFAEPYLIPNKITSMMDAVIRRSGKTVGILCCEHIGEMRSWTQVEELYVATLADLVALSMEVAERHRAESQLAFSLSLQQTIFESIADGVLAVALDGRIIGYNRRFVEMWKLPDDLVSRLDLLELRKFAVTQVCEPDLFAHRLDEIYATPDLDSHDIIEMRDGLVLERTSRPQMCGGRIAGRVWSFRDITESRRAQAELVSAKRLEAAGQLAGQIAHDINNLLVPLVAYPDLIRRTCEVDATMAKSLEAMQQSAERIGDVNQQLLTLARRGRVVVETIDATELIETALSSIEIPSGIQVETRFAPRLGTIRGAGSQLLRAIMNLLVNGIDAMNGVGSLRIEADHAHLSGTPRRYSRVVEGDYLRVRVCDSGPGIPDDLQIRIFEPFFSTKSADMKRGSGLGLSVVTSVMDDHNGYVDVVSATGQGTTFSLYLPIDNNATSDGAAAQSLVSGDGQNVLIVDDDPLQRDAIASMLELLGYNPTVASSGENAVDMLGKYTYDLVILDMVMGGIDGAETLRRIKTAHLKQRAIILSGFAHNDRVEEALRLGAHAFVAKPVRMSTLSQAVRDALNSPQKAQSAGAQVSASNCSRATTPPTVPG